MLRADAHADVTIEDREDDDPADAKFAASARRRVFVSTTRIRAFSGTSLPMAARSFRAASPATVRRTNAA